MRTVAIIQGRLGSQRLPGKILADILGKPQILRVVERARRAKLIDEVVVATSVLPANGAVEAAMTGAGVRCLRGSDEDVLDRYRAAAEATRAEVVVRLTGDCPLLDPAVIDDVVALFHASSCDYASNVHPPTFPDGLDTEVFTRTALERAWREARLRSEREHVTPYLVKHPELFRAVNHRHAEDLSALRWTVDEPQDLAFVRAVYDAVGRDDFGMNDVLSVLAQKPELARMNAGIRRNEGYAKSLREDGPVGLEGVSR